MGDPVLQVIVIVQLPRILPFPLPGDLRDIPGIVIGDFRCSVDSVPFVKYPLGTQPVTAVVFPEDMVLFVRLSSLKFKYFLQINFYYRDKYLMGNPSDCFLDMVWYDTFVT